MRILVVDDASFTRYTLKVALGAQGFEVVEASGGDDAIEQIETQHPDLVITDYNMPGMNGFQFFEACLARTSVPFFLITSLADETLLRQAATNGFCEIFLKPLDTARIAEMAKRHCSRDPGERLVKVRLNLPLKVLEVIRPQARAANKSVEDFLADYLAAREDFAAPTGVA